MILTDQLIQVSPRIQTDRDMTLGVFIETSGQTPRPYYVPIPFGSVTDAQALQDVNDEIQWLQDKIDTLTAWVGYFEEYLDNRGT